MTQWIVLYKKELLEMWRNYKWLWLPIVFVLLGALQPISTYYMPQILEIAGGLPEGAVIEFPTPTGGQMMAEVLNQYGTIGVLILVLAGMGIVSMEKQTRTISLVMVRPVPHSGFIIAKWAAFVTLGASSLLAGGLTGWYYTELLIGDVAFIAVLAGLGVYAMWLIFVMTVTVLMSTIVRGNSAVAFMTIIITIVISLLTSFLDRYMMWSPAKMSEHAASRLINGEMGNYFIISLLCTLIIIILLLVIAIRSFKRQELAD